jgi:NADPH-dependent 2,4-dienoyl-CoA reductase/sulfur reductase-like enzyme
MPRSDERFATNDERVFAAGDVARVLHAGRGLHVRVVQWVPARGQGRRAAAAMLGGAAPTAPSPDVVRSARSAPLGAGFGFAVVEQLIRRGDLGRLEGVASSAWPTGVSSRHAASRVGPGSPFVAEMHCY